MANDFYRDELSDVISTADRNYARDVSREGRCCGHCGCERVADVKRCTVCRIPLFGTERVRCITCTINNARAVDCACGFLYEGESCSCGGVTEVA